MSIFNANDSVAGALVQPAVEAPLHIMQEVNNARDMFKLPGPNDANFGGLINPMSNVTDALVSSGVLPKLDLDFGKSSNPSEQWFPTEKS